MSTNVFITGNGDYSLKFEGAESNPYLLYIDVNKILKDNPNCDITIKSIKVDGKSVDLMIHSSQEDIQMTTQAPTPSVVMY